MHTRQHTTSLGKVHLDEYGMNALQVILVISAACAVLLALTRVADRSRAKMNENLVSFNRVLDGDESVAEDEVSTLPNTKKTNSDRRPRISSQQSTFSRDAQIAKPVRFEKQLLGKTNDSGTSSGNTISTPPRGKQAQLNAGGEPTAAGSGQVKNSAGSGKAKSKSSAPSDPFPTINKKFPHLWPYAMVANEKMEELRWFAPYYSSFLEYKSHLYVGGDGKVVRPSGSNKKSLSQFASKTTLKTLIATQTSISAPGGSSVGPAVAFGLMAVDMVQRERIRSGVGGGVGAKFDKKRAKLVRRAALDDFKRALVLKPDGKSRFTNGEFAVMVGHFEETADSLAIYQQAESTFKSIESGKKPQREPAKIRSR